MIASDSEKCIVAVERWLETAVELFGDLFSLHGNLPALFAHHRNLLDQRLELLFQPVNRFHRATDKHSNRNHRQAITMNDRAITTITQNIGSLVLN